MKKQNHKVFVFDVNNSLYHECSSGYKNKWDEGEYNFWENQQEIDDFCNKNLKLLEAQAENILKSGASVVCFSVQQSSVKVTMKLAEIIKRKNKNAIIILGGPQCARWKSAEGLIKEPNVDAVVIGEGDVALPELIKTIVKKGRLDNCPGILYKKAGKIIDCGNREAIKVLDNVPFADFSGFKLESYKYPEKLEVFSSRGCVNRCAFCSERQFWGKYRFMSGKRIFDEIKFQLKNNKKLKTIRFNDSTLNGNIKELSTMCSYIIKSGINVNWYGQAIIRAGMSKELLKKMKKAGCTHLSYGMESGSFEVLQKMNKKFTIETARQVIRGTHEAGIDVGLNFMFGLPGETDENFRETLDFVKINRKYIDSISPNRSFCVIETITDLYNSPKHFGIEEPIHHLFWKSEDGKNNYPARLERYEKLCKFAVDLGIGDKNTLLTEKDKKYLLEEYSKNEN
ncbi:MAG: hypothetical protein A3J83_03905 [Elusimicrobia bacterium RIFOXYA2_FULL_40_6]|nr:MAG: hypothetical protein A3J83_03905 [Elusimicrobia bacterium RIFOXYA2_FULL_40_6]